MKIDISYLDGYLIRNIIKKEKEKLEREFNLLDELSQGDATCEISALTRIETTFQDAINKWEMENKK